MTTDRPIRTPLPVAPRESSGLPRLIRVNLVSALSDAAAAATAAAATTTGNLKFELTATAAAVHTAAAAAIAGLCQATKRPA